MQCWTRAVTDAHPYQLKAKNHEGVLENADYARKRVSPPTQLVTASSSTNYALVDDGFGRGIERLLLRHHIRVYSGPTTGVYA